MGDKRPSQRIQLSGTSHAQYALSGNTVGGDQAGENGKPNPGWTVQKYLVRLRHSLHLSSARHDRKNRLHPCSARGFGQGNFNAGIVQLGSPNFRDLSGCRKYH